MSVYTALAEMTGIFHIEMYWYSQQLPVLLQKDRAINFPGTVKEQAALIIHMENT